jgi:hypothetical protein
MIKEYILYIKYTYIKNKVLKKIEYIKEKKKKKEKREVKKG